MNHIAVIASALVLAASFAALADEPAPTATHAATSNAVAKTTIDATAFLSDGSTVRGELVPKRIVGSTIFLEKLALDPAIVKSVTFPGTGNEAKVELDSGDKFTMKVQNKVFTLKSMLGELKVPRKSLRSLTLAKHRVTAKCSEAKLVFHCTFDDEASITAPAVGPKGIFQGGSFSPGKTGNALFVPAHTQGAQFTLPAGSLGPAGTIEFWGNAEYGVFTDGGCPRFFLMRDPSTRAEISHDWNANNGSGSSGLTFRIDGLPVMSSSQNAAHQCRLPTSTPTGWHHYALVWDANGIKAAGGASAAVFYDGRLVMSTPFVADWKGPARLFGEVPLFFPNSPDEMPRYLRRGYFIDDFKIWNCAMPSAEPSAVNRASL